MKAARKITNKKTNTNTKKNSDNYPEATFKIPNNLEVEFQANLFLGSGLELRLKWDNHFGISIDYDQPDNKRMSVLVIDSSVINQLTQLRGEEGNYRKP